jgi:glutaminyl-peptide cyclotransferase
MKALAAFKRTRRPWLRLLTSALLLLGASAWAQRLAGPIPTYGYEIVRSYPHDPNAFTQGLLFKDGVLFESTGLEGRSSIRKVQLETGKVLMRTELPADVFGEGIVDWADQIIALTWKTQLGFVLKLKDFSLVKRFNYPGEGWGITRNDKELVMSDGSAQLRFINPHTLTEIRRLTVTANGRPVDRLNELEWVAGEVFANIWQTDRIARIDPQSGFVLGWIDLSGLLGATERAGSQADVLNGIAYDSKTKRLFVTGKLWPKLYEIKLVKR